MLYLIQLDFFIKGQETGIQIHSRSYFITTTLSKVNDLYKKESSVRDIPRLVKVFPVKRASIKHMFSVDVTVPGFYALNTDEHVEYGELVEPYTTRYLERCGVKQGEYLNVRPVEMLATEPYTTPYNVLLFTI